MIQVNEPSKNIYHFEGYIRNITTNE